MPTPIKVPAKVSHIIEHAPDLRSFILEPSRRVPAFLPGQFLHLAIDPFEPGSHWPESRVYSIASSPLQREQLRLTISRQGAFTKRLFEQVHLGSEVWLKLPYGSFCLNSAGTEPKVLIAGGSGITPFMSFLEWAVVHQPSAPIDLFYGAQREELLIYRSDIESCQSRGLTTLRTHYYVEHPSPGAPHTSDVRLGRLNAAEIWQTQPAPLQAQFHISGPKSMIDTFRQAFVSLGAPPQSVLSDDWA